MRRLLLTLEFALAAAFLVQGATPGRLDVTLVERTDCSALTSQSCFRLSLRAVDGRIPAAEPLALLSQFSIQANSQDTIPFHVKVLAQDNAGSRRSRVTLILLDVSGSMTNQQYEAALRGARGYAADFDPSLDVLAIATFGSRNVVNLIRSAPAARSRAAFERALAALPRPQPSNNTALYSAVATGIDWLENWLTTNPGIQAFLVVLTDGRNDVQPGDDPGLLRGPDGLRAISERIARSQVQVVPIGMKQTGNPGSVSESELRALGGARTRIVNPGDDLRTVFLRSRQFSLSDLSVSVVLPNNGQSLTGTDLRFQVTHSAGLTGTGVWRAPELGPSVTESAASPEELTSLHSRLDAIPVAGNEVLNLVRPIVVLVGWAIFLAILGFLLPRLIWPDADAEIYQTAPGFRPKGSYGFDSSPGSEPRRGRSERDKTIRVPRAPS